MVVDSKTLPNSATVVESIHLNPKVVDSNISNNSTMVMDLIHLPLQWWTQTALPPPTSQSGQLPQPRQAAFGLPTFLGNTHMR